MPCLVARVALILGLAAGTSFASASGGEADIARMTPEQLRALRVEQDRQNAAARSENTALGRRIQALEQRKAAHDAKKADLDARLADVRERLASLKSAQAAGSEQGN